MNILSINTTDSGGGAERVAYQILVGLNKIQNINCELLVKKKISSNSKVREIPRTNLDRALSRRYNLYFSTHGKLFFDSKREVNKIIKSDYDIVHLHNIHGEYFNLSNVRKIAMEKPVVWTLHDMWSFTGRCAYSYNCLGWQDECGCCGNLLSNYPPMKRDNSKKLLRDKKKFFVSNNIHIVTPSLWLKNQVEKSFMKGMDVRVINNGVDTQIYKYNEKISIRKKYNLDNEKIYLLFASADVNDDRKGFRNLINNINAIQNKNKFEILTLGKELPEGIIDKGFKVKQFGYIKEEKKLNEIYSLADVFIMPTLADNFPCSILESMSSGTAVISFNVGGVPEEITKDTGWIFENGRNEELIRVISNLTKEECSKRGELSRKRVEEKFTLDKCIDGYIDLYKEINKK